MFLLGGSTGSTSSGPSPTALRRSQRCLELDPDVVVLDFRLPDVDGARSRPSCAEVPRDRDRFPERVGGPDEYDAASSAGAALVRKDEGIDALVSAVRAAAGRRRE